MRSGAVPCVPSAAAALPPSPPSPSPPTPSFLLPLALTTNTASNQDLPVDASNVCEVQWRSVRLEDSSISDVSILRGPKSLRDFLQALSCLPSRSLLVTRSATELRQIVHPQLVREGFVAPPLLLRYVDVSAVSVECGQPPLDFSLPLEENLQALTERVLSLPRERLLGRVEEVRLGLEHAVCDRDTEVEKDVVVRTRGLPWQASDSHVADFFAGGVALCLSAEGRRNGEALVRFTSPEMRELALRRHRHFLLSRYIEVYRAASEDFLQVAAGSSSEAVLFVSRGAAMIVRCRGLPYDVTAQQIKEFFAAGPDGCEVMEEGILFVTKADGRATGDAFVLFNSEEDGLKALAKHKQTIGSRYIELFRSTQAEVQQVVSRSQELGVVTTANGKKDCVRLRGLPYEATVESVVEFLGESARGIALQGVHMVYNAQGHPSGEAFIQMRSEAAAAATASMAHNKFMNVGKKQRYIEVFQCSAEDMNLVVATASPPPAAPAPAAPPQTPLLLPRPPVFSNPQLPYTPYWPYPSPPVSPNMLLSQTGGHILLTGIGPSVTPQDIFAYFQSTPELRVESVQMLRWGTAGCPGEALVRVRAREPGVAPLVEAAFPLIHT